VSMAVLSIQQWLQQLLTHMSCLLELGEDLVGRALIHTMHQVEHLLRAAC
jgi:hypothetical protein